MFLHNSELEEEHFLKLLIRETLNNRTKVNLH